VTASTDCFVTDICVSMTLHFSSLSATVSITVSVQMCEYGMDEADISTVSHLLLRPGRDAEYCDKFVCLSVCL